ncbi:MAG: septation protein A [Deltaproteobacteria bacterium]|nr:septation protein A [Deltaproteobacteria bacterium]
MKVLFDLFPVLVFFVAFKVKGIYVATGVAIAASFAQIGWTLLRRRKVDPMLWVSLGIIVVFGGATLVLHNETFIKWKPTVLYWFFASALAGSHAFFGKNLIESLLKEKISLPPHAWRTLNLAWAFFFALLGGANLFVAYRFSTADWVNFKVFGTTGLMLLFVVLQGFYLSKHIEER